MKRELQLATSRPVAEEIAVIVHPSADVAPDAVIGTGTRIWHHAQVREGARIGRDCVIGKDVYIDRGVVIGDRVKIQNGVSVYHGVALEDEVFVGPHVSFTNDIRPRSLGSEWAVIATLVRRGASIGANATVVCGVTLGEYSMIGAGAVLTTHALPYGLYVGNPARLKGFVGRDGAALEVIEFGRDEVVLGREGTGERLHIRFEPRS